MHPGRKIIAISFFIVFGASLSAQNLLQWQLELGMGASQKPETRTDNYSNEYSNEQSSTSSIPVYGPVAGIHASLASGRHLVFRAGLQYQVSGYRNYWSTSYNGMFGLSSGRGWENQTYHKLALPVTAMYQWRIRGFTAGLFAGFRGNFMTYGKYSYYSEASDANGVTDVYSEEYSPLRAAECYRPLKRMQVQGVLGLALAWRRLELAATVYKGTLIKHMHYQPLGFCSTGFGKYYLNNDAVISLKYAFGK